MIVKNKMTPVDRAFWAHCEAVAREVSLWPAWMRGEIEATVRSEHIVFPATGREQRQNCCGDRYQCDVVYRCSCGLLACMSCMNKHVLKLHLSRRSVKK
jgi:hypothetical protein